MKEKNYYLNIHDIVKINSNFPFTGYKLGEASDSDISIEVKKDFEFSKERLSRLDYWFYGKEGENFVYYEDAFFGVKNKILLKNLDGKTEIEVTKPTLRLDRIYPPRSRGSLRRLIEAIIQIKQIDKGYLPIHASCLSKGGTTVLLAAFPNVGKTLSALQLLKDGYKYISDDTVLVDVQGTAYLSSFPSAIGYYDFLKHIRQRDIGYIRYYISFAKSWFMHKSKLLNRVLRPPLLNLGDLYETTNKAKVNIVCTLEIGPKAIKEIKIEEMVKKIKSINEYSLPRFYTNPFIKVYDFFNPGFNDSIRKKEEMNLLYFLTDCKCYNLVCDNWDWRALLQEIGV